MGRHGDSDTRCAGPVRSWAPGLAVALLALLLQAFQPMLHAALMRDAGADGRHVVLCTPAGIKVVDTAASGDDSAGKDAAVANRCCMGVCAPPSLAGAPTASIVALVVAIVEPSVPPVDPRSIVASRFERPGQPRGPPASV